MPVSLLAQKSHIRKVGAFVGDEYGLQYVSHLARSGQCHAVCQQRALSFYMFVFAPNLHVVTTLREEGVTLKPSGQPTLIFSNAMRDSHRHTIHMHFLKAEKKVSVLENRLFESF